MSNDIPLNVKYGMEQCVYTSADGKKLNYCRRQFGTAGKDSAVVLFLHGAGERGDNNYSQLVHGAREMSEFCVKNNLNVLALFPQCPKEHQWVNTPWNQPEHTMPEESEDMRLAQAMLDMEIERTGADRKRIYVMGISMGGYGTWDSISRYPEKFAAAFPVCGGVDVKQVENFKKVPLLIYHGEVDSVVMPKRSRDAAAALEAAGCTTFRYVEVPGRDHDSWVPAFAEEANWKWLFEQSK
jgi:predicted peptidase